MNAKPVGATGNGGGGAGEDYILIRDEKANNVDGGTFTSGAWRTRDLNTIIANIGSHASLATNQITLAAGTYKVRARCPAFASNWHKCKLWNVTDAVNIFIGSNQFNPASTQIPSFIEGRFTIAAPKVLELQHRCTATLANVGFGIASNFSVIEVYSCIEFWKEA